MGEKFFHGADLAEAPWAPELDRARDLIKKQSVVHKFGHNPELQAGVLEDVWGLGSAYPWPTAALPLRIRAGGNAADTAAGAGAQGITLVGLDTDFLPIEETVATAGASASAETSLSFRRLYRAYVSAAGAYTGANTGDIIIETNAGTAQGCITAAEGQTQMSMYTVPAGKTGYLVRVSVDVSGNKPANVSMWKRESADVVATPFASKRLLMYFDELSGPDNVKVSSYIPFPAKTDVWASAIALAGGGGSACSVNYDIILVDD